MLAVVKEKAAPGITVKKIPIPKPKKGEVLVKVINASICGTDIGIYDWTPWVAGHLKPPIVIGHEVVGKIIEINGYAPHLKIGDIVSSETHIFCDHCYQCHIGNRHVCENINFFGYGRDGGFAEYATIPIQTTWKNDTRLGLEAMSVQEPVANSVHVVTKAQVPGKRVLILGLGATGLGSALVAQVYGAADVLAVDPNEYRRKLAKKVGVDNIASSVDPKKYGSYDVVLEQSGAIPAIDTAFKAVRIAGTIMAFGIPKKEVTFDWGRYIIDKELTIKSVFGRLIWETWYQTQDLLLTGKIDLQKLITHRFKLEDFEKAMAIMKNGECGKIVLKVS